MKQGAPLQRRTGLRRTGPIKRRPRRRPSVDWDQLQEQVYRRDIEALVRHYRHLYKVDKISATFDGKLTVHAPIHSRPVCIATLVDQNAGWCKGRWTLNHVQDPGDPMYGRKVPDEPGHLVSLCEWHHQGQQAGHVWATASQNIKLQWQYLKETQSANQAPE